MGGSAENVPGLSMVPKLWVRKFLREFLRGRRAFESAAKVDPRGRLERFEVKMLA